MRHHGIEPQPPRIFLRDRCANDAGRMPHDERHLLWRAERCGDDEIALPLAVIIIGYDDEFALGDGINGFLDTHWHTFQIETRSRTCKKKDRLLSFLLEKPIVEISNPLGRKLV